MSEKLFLPAFEDAYNSFEIKRAENGEKPDPAVTGSDFAEILLSRQLTMDQQWFLAQFFLGKLQKYTRKRAQKIEERSAKVMDVANHYKARRAMPFKHKKTAIYQEIEERFGLKRSTVLNFLKEAGRDRWDKFDWPPSMVKEYQEKVLAWERSK
jgi:hypothetical protein